MLQFTLQEYRLHFAFINMPHVVKLKQIVQQQMWRITTHKYRIQSQKIIIKYTLFV